MDLVSCFDKWNLSQEKVFNECVFEMAVEFVWNCHLMLTPEYPRSFLYRTRDACDYDVV